MLFPLQDTSWKQMFHMSLPLKCSTVAQWVVLLVMWEKSVLIHLTPQASFLFRFWGVRMCIQIMICDLHEWLMVGSKKQVKPPSTSKFLTWWYSFIFILFKDKLTWACFIDTRGSMLWICILLISDNKAGFSDSELSLGAKINEENVAVELNLLQAKTQYSILKSE